MPDLDLLIRPGGEHRLSNFLLYQAAYAELVMTDVFWPDFSAEISSARCANIGSEAPTAVTGGFGGSVTLRRVVVGLIVAASSAWAA